jgi:cytochrome c551/c552
MFPKDTRLPEYFNKKLFIYDWIRNWIKVVTMQENGDFDKMEPFMGGTKFNSIIDMEVGPDGKLYLLEYGNGWFAKNADAGLSRIDFNGGNRAPNVAGISIDKTSGALPLKIVATVDAADPEKDELTYEWDLGNGEKKETKKPRLEYTYNKVGDYGISVNVRDDENAVSKSNIVSVYAGNDAPVVTIDIKGNKTFYFAGQPVAYSASVADSNDPSAASDVTNIFISADYLQGSDKAAITGHQVVGATMMGRSLTQSLDCKSCHKEAEKSIGPSFADVAKKYQKDPNVTPYLVNKIIKGGSGVWGETAMPAHPTLNENDAKQIVTWVMTLAGGANAQKSLPASGSINPTLDKKPMDNGVLILSASYTDKGGAGVKPLMGSAAVVLKSNQVSNANAHNLKDYTTMTFSGLVLLMVPKTEGWYSLDSLDLTGIAGADIALSWDKSPQYGYTFEVRLDSPTGQKIGEATLPAGIKGQKGQGGYETGLLKIKLQPVNDNKMHNLYFVSKPLNSTEEGSLVVISTEFKAGNQSPLVANARK